MSTKYWGEANRLVKDKGFNVSILFYSLKKQSSEELKKAYRHRQEITASTLQGKVGQTDNLNKPSIADIQASSRRNPKQRKLI